MKKTTTILSCALLLAACQQTGGSQYGYDNNPNTYKGAGVGAAVGAIGGALVSGGEKNAWKNAAIGGAIGGLAGAGVGQYMDRQEAEMRDQLQGSGVEVQRQGDDILLNMPNSITFDFNSSVVKSQFAGTVSNIANVLKQYPQTNVEVIGHTDDVGTDAYNQSLSEKRASAVVSRLIANGVVAGRLYAVGRGETQPVTSNATEAGRAENRRVEVKISPIVAQ